MEKRKKFYSLSFDILHLAEILLNKLDEENSDHEIFKTLNELESKLTEFDSLLSVSSLRDSNSIYYQKLDLLLKNLKKLYEIDLHSKNKQEECLFSGIKILIKSVLSKLEFLKKEDKIIKSHKYYSKRRNNYSKNIGDKNYTSKLVRRNKNYFPSILTTPENDTFSNSEWSKTLIRKFGSLLNQSKKRMLISEVEFSVISPKSIKVDEWSLIKIYMYEKNYRDNIDKLISQENEPINETISGKFEAEKGQLIRIVLESPDISIEENTLELVWKDELLTFTFAFKVPQNYKNKNILFNAKIYFNNVLATRLSFTVDLIKNKENKLKLERNDIKSIFMSYSSKDRTEVLERVIGMQAVRPDLDIFMDVLKLRTGQFWKKEIEKHIQEKDLFYLCWSHNAKNSDYVDWEWHQALKKRGIDFIEPLPLEPLEKCNPPEELQSKHFNEIYNYILEFLSHNDK